MTHTSFRKLAFLASLSVFASSILAPAAFAAEDGVTKVTVAHTQAYKPYDFINENG